MLVTYIPVTMAPVSLSNQIPTTVCVRQVTQVWPKVFVFTYFYYLVRQGLGFYLKLGRVWFYCLTFNSVIKLLAVKLCSVESPFMFN